jgi:serine/threonine protein kinase
VSDPNIVDLGQFAYQRDRRLGMPGGQASVYVGWQKPPLERRVAIKLLHEEHASDPTLVEAFLREARCYAALTHPNIVSVYGCDVIDGRPFIAMELVEGYDLRTWLREKDSDHPIQHDAALLILRDVGRALEAAHGATPPVAHRDLKPGNIMLSARGDVKLADFGLALVGDSQRTRTGTLKGSPPYMSPEQTHAARLDSAAAQRSDLFSFAVVAYELFTGSNPFLRGDLLETMGAVRDFAPSPLGEVNPRLAGGLGEAIDRALDKDPLRRGPGIGNLVDLIEDALETSKVGRQRNPLRSYLQSHGCVPEPAQVGPQEDERPEPDETVPGGEEPRPRPEPPPQPSPKPRPGRPTVSVVRIVLSVVALLGIALAAALVWKWTHPPGPALSQLVVDSSPRGASIAISGRAYGTTRDSVQGLHPGVVRIQLALPGYAPVDESLTLLPGQQGYFRQLARLDTLAFSKTYLLITRPYFANVQIDGGPTQTKHRFQAVLSSGRHEFHLVNRGLKVDRILEYDVQAGDTATKLILNYETGRVEPQR